jgi:hypothetical protein
MRRISLLFLIIVSSSPALLSGCGGMFSCDYALHNEMASPDGSLKAALLDVQCGATTADAVWVLLTDSRSKFRYQQDRVAVFEGVVDHLAWKDHELIVFYGQSKPFQMDQSSHGIRISYQKQ